MSYKLFLYGTLLALTIAFIGLTINLITSHKLGIKRMKIAKHRLDGTLPRQTARKTI